MDTKKGLLICAVLMMLSLSACATKPQPQVICPPLPIPPSSIMQPPAQQDFLRELKSVLSA